MAVETDNNRCCHNVTVATFQIKLRLLYNNIHAKRPAAYLFLCTIRRGLLRLRDYGVYIPIKRQLRNRR